MRIGIIGGGLMGMALGYRLSEHGHAVTVFERDQQLGGLATHHNFGSFFWDKFYHVVLPSDGHLLRFFKDIGLGDQIRWTRTSTGFYVSDQFYSVSNNVEFLRFPLVTLLGKLRLALTMLYCSSLNDWHRLEQIPVKTWLIKTCGRDTFENFWKPLLLAKLGENYQRVSAVFIWSYIKRLFSARDTSVQSKEYLGHVSGGYKAVFKRLEEVMTAVGGTICREADVTRVTSNGTPGLWIESEKGKEHFDKVVFTSPVNILEKVADKMLFQATHSPERVEYLGVVCMVLVTHKPLVPFYVLNIADPTIPFTGVIGMSTVVSKNETAGRYLTYFPKYVLSDDSLLRNSDEQIHDLFFQGIRKMFPTLREEEIESVHINRAFKVQPLQVLNYSQLVPKVSTNHQDFFVLNTSQFVNCTLNNNEVVRAVNDFLGKYNLEFGHTV